jgi:transcriptional regulator with GAF, ATPase, and Fis domain
MRRLKAYSWPGNIRELQNIIERAIVLSTGNVLALGPESGPALNPSVSAIAGTPTESAIRIGSLFPQYPLSSAMDVSLEQVERRHIETVLRQTNWLIEGNRGAAKLLGVNPSTLRSRLHKLGIKRPVSMRQFASRGHI